MKNRVFYALLGVALAAPVTAFAGQPDHSQQSGHYEWKSVPQYGPRATGPAQRRVWVTDTLTKLANGHSANRAGELMPWTAVG